MLVLYYFYNENLAGALSQYSQFSADYIELGRRVRRVIQPHAIIPLYRAGRLLYRNVTQLTIACINNIGLCRGCASVNNARGNTKITCMNTPGSAEAVYLSTMPKAARDKAI